MLLVFYLVKGAIQCGLGQIYFTIYHVHHGGSCHVANSTGYQKNLMQTQYQYTIYQKTLVRENWQMLINVRCTVYKNICPHAKTKTCMVHFLIRLLVNLLYCLCHTFCTIRIKWNISFDISQISLDYIKVSLFDCIFG